MTIIRINPLLQEHVELPAVVKVSGETVGECLDDLIQKFPHAKTWLFNPDSLLRVIISVNNIEVVALDDEGLNRKLKSQDEIIIFAIASGG